MSIFSGIIIAAIAFALHYLKRLPRIVSMLAFIAGVAIAYGISSWLLNIPSDSTAKVWTIRTCAALGVFGLLVFVHDVLPKLGSPRRWITPIMGIIVPGLLVLGIGGIFGQVFTTGVVDGVGGGVDMAVTTVFGNKGN